MTISWTTIFPGISEQQRCLGISHFNNTVGHLKDRQWQQEGTLLCTGTGRQRIGYAIRKGSCSWHFRNREAIALYREMGGRCTATAVTLSFKADDEPDYAIIGALIARILDHQ